MINDTLHSQVPRLGEEVNLWCSAYFGLGWACKSIVSYKFFLNISQLAIWNSAAGVGSESYGSSIPCMVSSEAGKEFLNNVLIGILYNKETQEKNIFAEMSQLKCIFQKHSLESLD